MSSPRPTGPGGGAASSAVAAAAGLCVVAAVFAGLLSDGPERFGTVGTGLMTLVLLAVSLPAVERIDWLPLPWRSGVVALGSALAWAAVGAIDPAGTAVFAGTIATAVGLYAYLSAGETAVRPESRPTEAPDVIPGPPRARPGVDPAPFERTQTRRVGTDGTVTCDGTIVATLPAGGPPFVAHLVFEPAFSQTPAVEAEVVESDGETPEVTVGEVRSFGARLEVRPPRDGDATIEIGWSAVGK